MKGNGSEMGHKSMTVLTLIHTLVCSFNAMKTDQFVNFKFITSRISSAMQNATQENWFFEHEVIYRFWNYCATELSS